MALSENACMNSSFKPIGRKLPPAFSTKRVTERETAPSSATQRLTDSSADPSAKGVRRANYTKSLGEGKKWVLKPEEEWVLSEIEPIVSEDLWNQCNQMLDEQHAVRKPPARKPVHLFTGFVHCIKCNSNMPVPSKSANYYCRKCHNKISISDLEFIFREQLKAFFLSPEEIAKSLSQADQTIRDKGRTIGHATSRSQRT